MKIYRFGSRAEYLVDDIADPDPLTPGAWLVPAGATPVPPLDDVPEGREQRFDAVSSVWYLADVPEPEPEPQAATPEQVRAGEIKARMAAIDAGSVRALRAKVMGKGKAADDSKLAALDDEAEALRVELAALVV